MVVVIGIFTNPVAPDFWPLDRYETDIIFSFAYSHWNGVPEFAIALDLLARGELNAERLSCFFFDFSSNKFFRINHNNIRLFKVFSVSGNQIV